MLFCLLSYVYVKKKIFDFISVIMQKLFWKPERTVLHQKSIQGFSYIILLSKLCLWDSVFSCLVHAKGPCTNETGYSLYRLEYHAINSDPHIQWPCLKIKLFTSSNRVQQSSTNNFFLWSSRNGCTHSLHDWNFLLILLWKLAVGPRICRTLALAYQPRCTSFQI